MALSPKKILKDLVDLKLAMLEDKSVREVWVVNNTNPKGEIALAVRNQSGGDPTLVTIPATWAPVCLTDQVPKSMLLNTPHFRKVINGGNLRLVTPESVAKIMSNPDVIREVAAAKTRTSTDLESLSTSEAETVRDTANPLVLDLIGREARNEIEEQAVLDILFNQEEILTKDDLEYLIQHSKFQKVKRWAAETITDKEEEDEDQDQ
jgi:hypothetical protein